MVQYFLNELGHPEFDVSPELIARLKSQDWPGNVRELRNVVERALLGNVDPLASMAGAPGGVDLTLMPFKAAKKQLVESFTREYVQALRKRCDGNISEVARTAGIARNWVHHLVTEYQLK